MVSVGIIINMVFFASDECVLHAWEMRTTWYLLLMTNVKSFYQLVTGHTR